MLGVRQRCQVRMSWQCRALLALALSFSAGCDLTQPTNSQVFRLVAVNGQALPYVEFGGTEIGTGRKLRALRTDGALTIFVSGRYLWEGTIHYEWDGLEDPKFPPSRQHLVGPYRRLSDTLLNLDSIFEARRSADGRRVVLTDRTGAFNGASFEFDRP
jgi:hypothetical protein